MSGVVLSPRPATNVSSLLSTLKAAQHYDYLRAAAQPDLIKLLAQCAKADRLTTTEVVQFADELIKINRKQKRQERVLVLTDRALYNFPIGSFKAAKRRIPLKQLRGVILSRCSDELVLQVNDEHDYRYETRRTNELLEMLSRAFQAVHQQQLMVTFSDEAQLKDQVITKDMLKHMQPVAASSLIRNNNQGAGGSAAAAAASGTQQQQHPHQKEDDDERGCTHSRNGTSGSHNGDMSISRAPARSPSPTSAAMAVTPSPASSSGSYLLPPNSPSHGSSGGFGALPRSPTNAPMGSTLTVGTAGGPPPKHLRRSLITHGSALLSPQVLAKIEANRAAIAASGGGDSDAPHAASSASGPTGAAVAPVSSNSSNTESSYRTNKKASLISTLFNSTILGRKSEAPPPSALGPTIIIDAPDSGMSHSSDGGGGGSAAADDSGRSNAAATSTGSRGTKQALPHSFRDPASRVEGWLTKQKGSSKTKWDRKYFILTHNELLYYAPAVKSSVKLDCGSVSVSRGLADGSAAEKAVSSNKGTTVLQDVGLAILRVESKTQKDPLIIALASAHDAEEWTAAFMHRNSNEHVDEYEQHPHMEGWLLHRERSSTGVWARRYCVLISDRVWFIEMGLKGSIDCSKGVSAHNTNDVEATEAIQAGTTSTFARPALTRFAYRWNVSDSERIFYLAADSQEDMMEWMGCIEKINIQHGRQAAGGSDNDAMNHTGGTFGGPDGGGAAAAGDGMGGSLTAGGGLQLPASFVNSVSQAAPEGQVTFVFTDVQSSTLLWDKVPDAMDAALAQHDRLLRELLLLYRGYEVKTEGDAFMVTFFTPLEAVLWCLHVQVALNNAEWSDEFCAMAAARREEVVDPSSPAAAGSSNPPSVRVWNGIRIRMGVHTGYPNARRNPVTGRMDYFGPVVNRSARVSDTGHGGQVVATQEVVDALRAHLNGEASSPPAAATAAAAAGGGSLRPPAEALEKLWDPELKPIISDQGFHELKGINEPVKIYEIKPHRLRLRTLPPLRSATTEKMEAEQKNNQAAAAAAAAAASE